MSRLLGKMAIEALAYRICNDNDWLDEITDKPELDELKRYVRRGDVPEFWEYHQRRIYDEEDMFYNPKISNEPFQRLHEFQFLYVDGIQLYFTIAIMGIEYTINFTNQKIDGYLEWLEKNKGRSPLFDPNEKLIKHGRARLWRGKNSSG